MNLVVDNETRNPVGQDLFFATLVKYVCIHIVTVFIILAGTDFNA